MVSTDDIKRVHSGTGLDDTCVAENHPSPTVAVDFSTIHSDTGDALYLQSGERFLLLPWNPPAPKAKPY